MSDCSPLVALGSRLRGIPQVITLGVKPNFLDYDQEERNLIKESRIILYPSRNYAQFFNTSGKRTFPGLETYLYADNKIMQTTLFYMMEIPHPRTRIYYHLHHEDILKEFSFPFIGKIPRDSARGRGVFLIREKSELRDYLSLTNVAYIQEFLPHDRDLRVVLINYDPVIAYWRYSAENNFRTNLAQGGTICFDDIPEKAVQLAVECAKRCKFDDVGVDLICSGARWSVIEANMKYGRKGLRMKDLDLKKIMTQKLVAGEIG